MTHARPGIKSLLAWTLLVLALAAWGGFAYLVGMLSDARSEYAELLAVSAQESERSESSARLRSLVQGTEVERAALESIVSVPIVDAVETVEAAAQDAGARNITIGEATTQTSSPQNISTVSLSVHATGSFTALVRAVLLFEKLPIPSVVDQFEISKNDKEWRLVARLRLTLSTLN